jgi:type VI secretion system protein
MPLVLTVVSYRRQPMAQPMSQRFEAPVVTVGRGPEADWALPDPDQFLSKKHCTLRVQSGRCTITDTSTNGVFINGSPERVGNGRSEALGDGDWLQLGDYEILVRVENAPRAQEAAPALQGMTDPDDPFGIGGGNFVQTRSAASPFAPIATAPAAAGLGGGFPAGGFPGPADPFAAAPRTASFASPPPGTPLLSDTPDWLLPETPSLGELAPDQYAQPDHLASEHVQFMPPPVIPRGQIPDNWNVFGGGAAPAIPTLPPHHAAAATAPPATPQLSPPPIPPAPPAAAAVNRDGGLLGAFLEGAGIDPSVMAGQDPAEMMALAGQLLREMAWGLRDALAARTMIKSEYRVQQTMIGVAMNNPLKFSVEPNQVLQALLSRSRPGYLAGLDAVAEGFKDLRGHELALFGAMQSAVAALVHQFDPEQLKQRLEQQSLLQNILPAARKAKYWEMYEQHYKHIADDISENVRGTFGRAFASAYEEQARKL